MSIPAIDVSWELIPFSFTLDGWIHDYDFGWLAFCHYPAVLPVPQWDVGLDGQSATWEI